MNMKEFIGYYAAKNDITKTQAKAEIERFTYAFKSGAIEEGEVNLIGFMKAKTVVQKARERVNPRTGETIKCPEKKIIKVTLAKKFKDMVVEE